MRNTNIYKIDVNFVLSEQGEAEAKLDNYRGPNYVWTIAADNAEVAILKLKNHLMANGRYSKINITDLKETGRCLVD